MAKDVSERLSTLREKVRDGERDISNPADTDRLLEFSDELDLLRTEYSDYRHLKLLRHCTRIAEHVGGLDAALRDEEAAKDIVRWINRTYDNEETNRDYRSAIRVFGKRVTNGDVPADDNGIPESLAWIPTGTSNSYDPAPDPAKMLRWDRDVMPMVEAARNPRDKALIAVQFDGGFRGGELHDIRREDVADTDSGLVIRVDGKTGERSVDLIPSVPYLNQWLAAFPGDREDYLWTKLTEPERVSYSLFLRCFREPAKRAGVEKPVTPTNFRKSNASWLARQGANAALIEDRQGRSRGSNAVARYVARFGDDAEIQYAALHGKEVDTQTPEDIAPLSCPRCAKDTPRDNDICVWCGQALSHTATDRTQQQRQDILASALGADGDLVDSIQALDQLLDEHPALRALLDD